MNLQLEGVAGGGIVQFNPQTSGVGYIDSGNFVGTALVVSNDATATYAIGSNLFQPTSNMVASFTFGPTTTLATFPNAGFVDLKVSADGKILYVLDSTGTLDILDAKTLTQLAFITVGGAPTSISLSPDGTQAIVTDGSSTSVSLLDLQNRVVLGKIQVGGTSHGSTYLD